MPETPAPGLSSETGHHTNPRYRNIQVDSGYMPISAEGQTLRNQAPGLPYRSRPQAKTKVPDLRTAHMDPSTRAIPVNPGSRPAPREQTSLMKKDGNTVTAGNFNTPLSTENQQRRLQTK